MHVRVATRACSGTWVRMVLIAVRVCVVSCQTHHGVLHACTLAQHVCTCGICVARAPVFPKSEKALHEAIPNQVHKPKREQ